MTELRFDDKVAIITGAGGGLGRSHALLLASRGAKVVINDLGGGFKGDGNSTSAADRVVEEIRAAGGQAIANYDSVTDGDKLVRAAVDAYGHIDILINNAGILRDVSFPKMTQEDWDKIYAVHTLGAFKTTHAAFLLMRDQGYGRIVMTSSAAGIYGNFGQVNYATAKLGLVGFANALAVEGRKRNVLVNSIAPIAGSRMTETVLPPALLEALQPELVSPLVARLCHESSDESGGLFEVGGGFFAKLRWERSTGKTFRLGRPVSIEDVDRAWADITGFGSTTHPEHIAASMQPIIANVEAGRSRGGNQFIDVDAALGFEYPERTSRYDERDLALYALGVGAAQSEAPERDLQTVYELHGKGMKALPTFAVVPAVNLVLTMGKEGVTAPGLNFGLDRVLHGEQYTELLRPLPTRATLTHRARIKDIFDKGKGAVVVTEIVSSDDSGRPLIRNEVTAFVRGAGGWGGERGPTSDSNTAPPRPADKVIEQKVPAHQALLYRLSGDWNPLHADPEFAKAFGFERPILHGLCSFGYAGRHVIAAFAPDGNPDFMKSIRVRFANPLLPGETLVTEMWKEGDRILFQCRSKERNQTVISHAAIELWKALPKALPVATAAAEAAATAKGDAAASAAPVPTTGDIFRAMNAFFAQNPAVAAKANAVFLFQLSAPDSAWTIDTATPPGRVLEGAVGKAQTTLALSDGDFMAMATGKSDPMKLFSTGKLKISGDVMAAQKLGFLQKMPPELVFAEARRRGGATAGGATAGGATSGDAASGDAEPTTAEVFAVIADFVERTPEVVAKVGATYLWKIKSPDSYWLLDLKSAPGRAIQADATANGECSLEITESDFIALTQNKADAMKLFTTGKLKISGNVMAAQKLEFLRKLDPQRAQEVVRALRGATPREALAQAPVPTPQAAAKTASARASEVFSALSRRLRDNPALASDVRATVQFNITDPQAAFTVTFLGEQPNVGAGRVDRADATLTLSDAALVEMASGKSQLRSLYQHGAVRIDGDVAIAHRLGVLNGLLEKGK